MTLEQLIKQLVKVALDKPENKDLPVVAAVGWSGDTAFSDKGEDLKIKVEDGRLVLEGWLSNCGTELVIDEEGDEV